MTKIMFSLIGGMMLVAVGASAADYTFESFSARSQRSPALYLTVTISGGGTRAAAYGAGALQELARTPMPNDRDDRTLFDEIDIISAVSGGAFPAAFVGLYGRDGLRLLERRFLHRNIEWALKKALFSPRGLVRVAKPSKGRSDIADHYYDRALFDSKTFSAMSNRADAPFIIINATDISLGRRFAFTQDQFDAMCSDLSAIRISTAVAASSAFPVLLSPVTVRSHTTACRKARYSSLEPADAGVAHMWVLERAAAEAAYRTKDRRFIHLIDGGTSDNLGLTPLLDSLDTTDSPYSVPIAEASSELLRVVVVIVDAHTAASFELDRSDRIPGVVEVMKAATFTPIGLSSLRVLSSTLASIRNRSATERPNEDDFVCTSGYLRAVGRRRVCYYPIYVPLMSAQVDESLSRLPTSFNLPIDAVTALQVRAAEVLKNNPTFRALVSDLRHGGDVSKLVR